MNKIYDRVSSLAETEYIIQCDSGAHLVGTYDGGTDAVREYTAVKLVKFPGNEVLDETTVYGADPPDKIEYTGNAPPYQSGGKPSTEEVSAVILTSIQRSRRRIDLED